MPAADTLWNRCIDAMRADLSDEQISTWLLPLQSVRRNGTLKLLAPNQHVLRHVTTQLLRDIERAVLQMDGGITRVECEIGGLGGDTAPRAADEDADCNLNAAYTFARHVEASSNQIARAAAQQAAMRPGDQTNNPLFIYGGVGLGKTHLMQAAGHLMLEKNSRARVLYVHSERFVNDLVNAIRGNKTDNFKKFYRSRDALLIDDIQFLTGKTQSQEEFFNTFNFLLEGRRQIIITSDRIPRTIERVDERLISRFEGGLAVGVQPPELETRLAILAARATEREIVLPDEVAHLVAGLVHSSVRELEGALNRIDALARFSSREIDVALAREALQDLLNFQQTRINIDNIQQKVAGYFNIRVSDMSSKSRARNVARPRQLAMFVAREYTNMSLPEIGDHFGGRDHSTVLHACRRIGALLKDDAQMREDYANLQRQLGV